MDVPTCYLLPFSGVGKNTPERISRLEAIGFEWDVVVGGGGGGVRSRLRSVNRPSSKLVAGAVGNRHFGRRHNSISCGVGGFGSGSLSVTPII